MKEIILAAIGGGSIGYFLGRMEGIGVEDRLREELQKTKSLLNNLRRMTDAKERK